ncbi:MAG: MBL fold metallo-hydrolase, partial [Clostridiales bacterium]|nr:MBL fold metallo-hydrolase [Candidatus Equinaster intestinalis]
IDYSFETASKTENANRKILIGPIDCDITKPFLNVSENEYILNSDLSGNIIIFGQNSEQTTNAFNEFIKRYIPYYLNSVWKLNIPEYIGGKRASNVYNCGGGLDLENDPSSYMQIINDTSREQFDNYITTLSKNGYKEISNNCSINNLYVQYYNSQNNRLVYAYYIDSLKQANIIEDTTSIPKNEFEYFSSDDEVNIYQYAMMYNRNGNGDFVGDSYPNCGMFYIIKSADNRLFLIDGGDKKQATDKATKELYKFLHEITGKQEDEKIDIACWFLTHAHQDHYSFVDKLINLFPPEKLNIERIMCNIPTDTDFELGEKIKKNYTNVKFIKLHTGQKLSLGNIKIEVLFTHEDYVDNFFGTSIINDFNNTSTVLKLFINGKTMIISGDWGGCDTTEPVEYSRGLNRMMAMHTNHLINNLKSDILQVSHHALNPYMDSYNSSVSAKYAFVPAADVKLEQQAHPNVVNVNINQIQKYGCNPENIYFASRYIYCLNISKNGKINIAVDNIRGADTGDNVITKNMIEQDYINDTLKAYNAYRVPLKQEFLNWKKIHSK